MVSGLQTITSLMQEIYAMYRLNKISYEPVINKFKYCSSRLGNVILIYNDRLCLYLGGRIPYDFS